MEDEAVAQALKLAEAERAVKEWNNKVIAWNEKVMDNLTKPEVLNVCTECLNKAREDLNKAREDLDKAREHQLRLIQAREHNIPKAKKPKTDISLLKFVIDAPSSFAKRSGKPGGWISVTKKFGETIKCHRCTVSNANFDDQTVPIVLLNETFARFEKNCETIDIESSDCDFVMKFCEEMSAGYVTEDSFAEKARNLLSTYLFADSDDYLWISPVEMEKSISDGSVLMKTDLLLNLEIKVQKGDGGGCPTMQNIGYYIKNLPDAIDKALPCFLIDICGPLLSIFGIINTGKSGLLCEPLVPSFPLLWFDNPTILKPLVRVCASLKTAMKELVSLHKASARPTLAQSEFPYKDTATIDGKDVKLCYMNTILRYVFDARVDQAEPLYEVIVKFAKSYDTNVHLCCAEWGIAPKLLYHEQLVNQWYFIVMEKLELLPLEKAPKKTAVISQLQEIQEKLSSEGIVHGDCRENNIRWDVVNSRVVLIDFDWSGEDGKVKYPYFMNPEISWPPGAETNKPILIEHDKYWMDMLLSALRDYEQGHDEM